MDDEKRWCVSMRKWYHSSSTTYLFSIGFDLMTSTDIQNKLAMCCTHEVIKVIMEELGHRQLPMLIDKSHDISVKEQMTVMLRFSNDKEIVVGRFIALHHVKDTTYESLNDALYCILDKYILSISRIRWKGYDGASNMRDKFNDLQRNILDENPYAFYVHCYARCLQLVVVYVASYFIFIHDFFEYISLIEITSSASFKRMNALTEAKQQDIVNKLESDFSDDDRGTIRDQLETYVVQVKRNSSFSPCKDVQSLTTNMINGVWFNDLIVFYTEREIFKSFDDIDIIRTFTTKKSRKGYLSRDFI
ncbi:unnamed protein product [Vicia faba]|uniref:DUF4371 domain-containing protein n=1 Tax=Vicia faba TaxID=3906 RepID=A0AAV1AGY9_VICFA|nr:unnamed protein product [Vicia faba]